MAARPLLAGRVMTTTERKAVHTPTPWKVAGRIDMIGGPDHEIIVDSPGTFATKLDAANIAHIVRCVNAHDELVAALEAAHDGLPTGSPFAIRIAAILAKVSHD